MPAFLAAIPPALSSLVGWFATPTGIGLSTAAGLGSTAYFMSGGGQPSEEEQERMLRRQLEIQDEFDQRRAERAGGDPMAGLVGGGPRDLAGLVAEDQLLDEVSRAAYSLNRARNARSRTSDELERILEGQTARIAALQSERVLSPLEVIQMMEMMGG